MDGIVRRIVLLQKRNGDDEYFVCNRKVITDKFHSLLLTLLQKVNYFQKYNSLGL